MLIIADKNIPFLKDCCKDKVKYLPADKINHSSIKNADILLIRTRTKTNQALLKDSKVNYIASATIGTNHIDQRYLKENSINWTNSPGCNANSVLVYMTAALMTLKRNYSLELNKLTLGVIGYGNTGKKTASLANCLGMNLLINDPPLEKKTTDAKFCSLQYLLKHSHIIALHVPYNKIGAYKTHHLISKKEIKLLSKNNFVINVCRGEIICNRQLQLALENNKIKQAILDVWENEPNINQQLVNNVLLGTPHIAGYSADGKANATKTLINFINKYHPNHIIDTNPHQHIPKTKDNIIDISKNDYNNFEDLINDIIDYCYDIKEDSKRLKNYPENFEKQRNNYPIRRDFSYYQIKLANKKFISRLKSLGFQTSITN